MNLRTWIAARRDRARNPGPLPQLLLRRTVGLTVSTAIAVGTFMLGLTLLGDTLTFAAPHPDGTTPRETLYPGPGPDTAAQNAEVDRLSARYGCSTSGLPAGVIAARSIVRDPDGTIRATSFDEGWAMLEGTREGTLVSVCAR